MQFPEINRLGDNVADTESAWSIYKKISPRIDGQSIYSFKYASDGKSVIVGTSDFNLFRIRLSDGSQIWKTPAKMMYQKEFDGPSIYDVSLDGKYFLSFGQTDPKVQASERFLVLRSADKGDVVRSFAVESSLFYSQSAAIDHRYPGAEEEQSRIEAGLGFPWILTIAEAKFIEGGKKILASYKNNMDGPNFYDRRLIIYDTATGKKLNDFQLTCDKATANWDQPAGFEIAHIQFPFAYSSKKKTLLFGTAHGRIHEIDEMSMSKGMSIPMVENKPSGKVVYTPLSDAEDMEVKDRQTVRSVALSPDNKVAFVSAGTEGGYIQVYAYDLEAKHELFRSSQFDAGTLLAPSSDTLVIGGMFSSARFFIVDVKKGKLIFSADEDENYIHPQIFATNPGQREVAGLNAQGGLSILRPKGNISAW